VPDTESAQPDGAPAGRLRVAGQGGALETEAPREWLVSGVEELFRGIYTRAGTGASEILAVCSAIAGEGKTTISLGLGVTIAQDFPERRVLLVETDFQRPVLAKDFGFEPSPGLVDCLLNDRPLQFAYRATLLDNLHLVPAGGSGTNSGRVLRSSRMAAAVDAMRQTHDLVILDVPAILANSDGLLLTDLADGTILAVQAGVTPTSLVSEAIEQLDHDKLRGVVLNGTDSAIPGWLQRLCGL
jgi:Mrp family chromosome partitioning ATPase